MKKKIIALLSAATLLTLTSCSSEKTLKDAEALFKNYKDSYASYVVKEVVYVDKDEETNKPYRYGEDNAAYNAVIDAKFEELKNATLLKYGSAIESSTANFYAANPNDIALAEQYKETLTYDINKNILTVTYEGSSSIKLSEDDKNSAFAFSYLIKYSKEGLVTKEILFASFVQQVKDKDPSYARAYRTTLTASWQKA